MALINRIWRSIVGFLPSPASNLLARISNLYPGRYRRRRHGLPLPLHSIALQSSLITYEAFRAFGIIEDIMDHTMSSLHIIQKSLQFWQSRAKGTNTRKMYFMLFERGPRAFIDGTFQMICRRDINGSPLQHLSHSAADTISDKIAILTHIERSLAAFLAQVYLEVGKCGELLTVDSDKSLPSLLMTINNLFSMLEASISHPHMIYKSDASFSSDGGNSCALVFEKIPEIDQERSQWTDTEIRDASSLIYQNLQKLDSYLSFILSSCQKPGRMTLYWLHYTCGAVGLSVCSMWILRHSSLMGSSDIDNWVREAKESTTGFWKEHVEQPLISIRDELFETFRRRHKGVMEVEEVQLTINSLQRYEKEVMHPLQNLLSGELAQIQKLMLDLETEMLELDQILSVIKINFAILAVLPAFVLSLMLVRAWGKGAEGRGRVARIHRRFLLGEVKKRIMQIQIFMDKGMEEDAQWMFGLVLYSLDRLYKAVESHARETGEWLSLREDIVDLGKPDLRIEIESKLFLTSRIERMYECMLPSSKPSSFIFSFFTR